MPLRKSILTTILISMLVTILSCGSGGPGIPNLPPGENPEGYKFAASDYSRDTSPDVPQSDMVALADGNTEFAFDIYQELMGEDGNIFYSPFSISQALAMTYLGARGNTETQMADTLHYTLSQDDLHPAFNKLDIELHSRGVGAQGKDGEGFRLNIANSTWGQDGYSFLQGFLDALAINYGAGMRLVDFLHKPEECRGVINRWVEWKTEDRIVELIPPMLITIDTRLVLVNAIYFNAAWNTPFEEYATQPGDFTLLDRSTVTVPLMHQTEGHRYTEGDGFQACEIRYDGAELSMVILLPDIDRFDEIEASLSADFYNGIIDSFSGNSVDLTLPKFEYESDFQLADTLISMGMPDAFGNADFSGMDGTRNLFISDVVHKAFVSVDEEGTEAAAATAVIMNEMAMPMGVEFRADHPFIFFIRDIQTGTILFIGRMLDPR